MPDDPRALPHEADEIRRLSETLARDPGSLAFLRLGDALRREGRIEQARRVAEHGVGRHPDMADAHALLGRVLADAGLLADAEICWQAVERLAPGHLEAARGLAFVRWREGRVAEARALLEEAHSRARDEATRRSIEAALGRLDLTPPAGVARLTPLVDAHTVPEPEPEASPTAPAGAAEEPLEPAPKEAVAALAALLSDAEAFGETLAIGDCQGLLVECDEGLLAVACDRVESGERVARFLAADDLPVGRAVRAIVQDGEGERP